MTGASTESRLIALERVLLENALTVDALFQAVAGVLSNVPGIADDLRAAATLTADAPTTEPDAGFQDQVRASRERAAAVLNGMADVVATNLEKTSRILPATGTTQ